MVHVLTHAAGIVLLGVLFYATGYLVERTAPWGEFRALGRGLVRVAVGIVGWIVYLFILACVGGLSRTVVLPTIAIVILVAALQGFVRPGGHARAQPCRQNVDRPNVHWLHKFPWILPISVPAAVLVAIFVSGLSPRIGWDDDTYHLTLPKLYLANGGFRPVPFNVYSHWPHNVELLYALAMMVQDYVTAKLLHGFFLALLLFAVYRVTCRYASSTAAILATVLVLGNAVLLNEATIAYVDIAVAFLFFMAITLAWEHLDSGRTAPLILSGICCGAVAGCKLSGIAGLPCVLALVLAAHVSRRSVLSGLSRVAGCLVLPTLILAVPWYARSYVSTGDPFYPLLYRYLGGVEWSAALDRQFLEWQQSFGLGQSLRDLLVLPIRVIESGGRGYVHSNGNFNAIWIALVPLTLVASRWVPIARRALLPAAVFFLAWGLSARSMRYLIPELPLLAISAGATLEEVLKTLRHPARRVVECVLVMGACLWLLVAVRPTLAQARSDGKALAQGGPDRPGPPVPPGYAFINANTPTSAKIMLLNTNHGFFLEREYIADSFFEASQMNDLLRGAHSSTEVRQVMSRLGITHVYVASTDWHIAYPQALWEFLGDVRTARLVYTCTGGWCTVYDLRGSDRSARHRSQDGDRPVPKRLLETRRIPAGLVVPSDNEP